jgi:peroxiredoxin
VLSTGDQAPDVQTWLTPRESVSLHDLVSEGPVLVFFYLFDWSGT